MTDSTNGLTNTLQTVQTGDGDNSPLQISTTQVNISGSFTVNGTPITGSSIDTGSFATTGSNIFTGKQTITGSNGKLVYDGTMLPDNTLASIHADNDTPWLERFYNDTFSPTSSVMSYFAWNDGRFIFHNESTSSIAISTDGYVNDNLVIGDTNTTSNNDIVLSGSLDMTGAITWSNSAFNYLNNVSGALYFSALSGGTLHLNDDGGEGDVYMLNTQGNKLHINGDTIQSGSIYQTGSHSILSGSATYIINGNASTITPSELNIETYTDNANIYIAANNHSASLGVISWDGASYDNELWLQADAAGIRMTDWNNGTGNISAVPFMSVDANDGSQPEPQFNRGLRVTGSLHSTDVIGTGSLFLKPDQNDARYLQVYNTSPTDTHITASGGQLFIGNDVTYVKVDNYGSVKRIDIVADNGTNISGSVAITGSLDIIGNISADSASFNYLHTIYETASVIYSSGSNQLGDELTDDQILSGSVYVEGAFYINGVPITNGTSGTSGTSGSSGVNGSSGSSGTAGTSGSSGVSGSSGTSGSRGTSGTSGSSGANGSSGSSGSSGTRGTSGTSGSSGANGSSGTSGSSGVAGANGSSGTSGTAGSSGTAGTSGSSGANGSSGTAGTSGSSGANGSNGSSGTAGTSGSSGNGTSGTSGTSGVSNSFFNYQAKTVSTSGDPGSGYITWNQAPQTGATFINVSEQDTQNDNLDIFIGNIASGSTITLQDKTNHNNYQVWNVGTSVDNTTYYTFPVTLVSATHQFSGNDNILFIITTTPPGTSGTSGTSGSSGNGSSGSSGTAGTSGSSGNGTSGSSGTAGTSGSSGIDGSSGTAGTSGSSGVNGSSGSSGTAGTSGTSATFDSGSYATTGSNTFTGVQTLTNTQYPLLINNPVNGSGQLKFGFNTGTTWAQQEVQFLGDKNYFQSNGDLTFEGTLAGATGSITFTSGKDIALQAPGTISANNQITINSYKGFIVNDNTFTAYAGVDFYTGGTGTQAQFTSTADKTYIQSKNDLYINSNNGGSTTGSIYATSNKDLLLKAISGTTTVTSSIVSVISPSVAINSPSVRITGSLISSGSLTEIGNVTVQNPNMSLTYNNVSSSYGGNVLFGWDGILAGEATSTGSYVISGSNNILAVTKPRSAVGLYNYVSGSSNIMLGGTIAMTTASLLRPVTSNNIINFGQTTLYFQSSSVAGGQPSYQNNILNQTFVADMGVSGSLTATGNIVNGATSIYQTGSAIANLRSTFNANNINSTFFVQNYVSSSFTVNNNNTVGATHYIDNYWVNGFGTAGITASRNFYQGQANFITFSGSPSSNTSRAVSDNFLGGNTVNINAIVSGSNAGNSYATIIYGYNLQANATATGISGGSAFLGRFNDTGSFANTSDIVFAVGTGTAAATRRNGLTIDTGSNVLVSGSFNVSGSATFSGTAFAVNNNASFGTVNMNATGSGAQMNLRSVAVTVSGSNTISLNSTNTNVTGSLKLANVMNLRGQDPLPAGTIGDLAVSSSNKLYFYNGAWTLIV